MIFSLCDTVPPAYAKNQEMHEGHKHEGKPRPSGTGKNGNLKYIKKALLPLTGSPCLASLRTNTDGFP